MFVTPPFQCPEVYSPGKMPYTGLFDMSGFFSDQARQALEGDSEMASHLFAADSCQSLVMSSPAAAYPQYQPVFYESSGYYQVPYMAGSFESSASVSPVTPVSPVWSHQPQQQHFDVAVQRYSTEDAAAARQIQPVPSYHAVPRLSHPRRHHIHSHHNHNHHQHQHQKRHAPSSASSSPSIASDSLDGLSDCGVRSANGTWRCAHPGCSSKTVFTRACDLRKHYNRHRKYLFCRFDGCPQSREGGFSSKKDRARHEAKHNPQITCEWQGCGRVFSRADNMKDHVRRIHCRGR